MAQTPDLQYAIGLKPEAAIAYFRSLGYRVSDTAIQAYSAARHRAFTVTGVAKMDLLNDIKTGIDKALADGTTFAAFKEHVNESIARRGWLRPGERTVADVSGEVVAKDLSPHRMQTVFRTNIQSAYMAGKYQQLQADIDIAPYWQYLAVMDSRTRPSHAAMHSMVFRHDDAVWGSHFPPCDYNCRCTVRALRGRDLDRLGLSAMSSDGMLEPTMQHVGKVPRPVTAFVNPTTKERYVPRAGFGQRPELISVDRGLNQAIGQKLEKSNPGIAAAVTQATPGIRAGISDEYRTWAQTVMQTGRSKNDYRVLSVVSSHVQEQLSRQNIVLGSSAITLRDVELLHLLRDTKKHRSAVISEASILNLPRLLDRPIAVLLDTQDQALIYVVGQLENNSEKIVIRMNRRVKVNTEKGRTALETNSIRTAGVVKVSELKSARYQVLEGVIE